MPLLTWGVSDGSITEREIGRLIDESAPGLDVDEVLDDLLDRGLVFAFGISEQRFRSRMAETVRLVARLRQWFHGQSWTAAANLVSDMRFLSAERSVPRRDVDSVDLDTLLRSTDASWTDRHQIAMNSLLAGRSVSAFQARAHVRLSQPLTGHRGTVISAGTGSGKTLAFYLPILTRIAGDPRPGGVPRIIAIYPRIELLRDQLRSILITCRSLGKPVPRVGVFYGAVPRNRDDAERSPYSSWKKVPGGLLCPIIDCIEGDCDGRLIWPTSAASAELLRCEKCGSSIDSDVLTFTRDALKASAPTILFTTTEMVNRELGSKEFRRLLVGDDVRSPEFVLLDEVHTYSGTHGAQVANLLRRWRAEVSNPPHLVGLSATLADPVGFFAELTGLSTFNIVAIKTEASEMREVGREYFLALRGDPASRKSLLSTTIQTAMLMRRMLDPSPAGPSFGSFGSKLFIFMDDLDVTNRLYSQLLDAEGWRSGGVNRKPDGSLAVLRTSAGAEVRARDDAGQVWRAAEDLGTLNRSVRIARTTSRDGGVDTQADVVVATASLEVGFDDPAVGAVVQHKAPRDAAQFIQRRGRAGRDPLMRPWTVVVLSDFGRDRLAFQSYETLFAPVVPRMSLPLQNRSILKMQATWWLLDRLSRSGSGTSIASVIAKPWSRNRDSQRQHAERLLAHVRNQLNASAIERMGRQLQRALSLSDEDLRAVLWDHPRGLVPSVFPTLIRGLEVAAAGPSLGVSNWPNPLAPFLPLTLFSPLQTPEIEVVTPWSGGDVEAEPVSQGMRQFAPGRVSYRYAKNGKRDRLWVAPPLFDTPTLQLSSFCLDYTELESPPAGDVSRLVQLRRLDLTKPDSETPDSSYGEWNWRVDFRHDGEPLELDMPSGTALGRVVTSIEVFTHRHRCPQTVWRYASTFTVRRNLDGTPPLTEHSIQIGEDAVDVGFVIDVDGLAISVCLPPSLPDDHALLQSLRVARMEFLVRTNRQIVESVPSPFTRDWLHQILLSVLVVESQTRSLNDSVLTLTDADLRTRMIDVAREIFGVLDIGESSSDFQEPDVSLITDISAALKAVGVIHELRIAASVLWASPGAEWKEWLDERYLNTLGSAFVEAVQNLCPEVDAGSLLIDISLRSETDTQNPVLNISEDEPGGLGVIEAFIDKYVEDPRRFWSLVETGLGPSDGERVDENIRRYLTVAKSAPVAGDVASIRGASDLAGLIAGWQSLRTSLFAAGLACDHAIISALSTRLLRPGSNESVDLLVADLLVKWDEIESRLGIDVELRVFAYVALADPDLKQRLLAVAHGHEGQQGWEIGQVVGLLWSRGYRLRSSALQTYSPFRKYEPTERLLFRGLIEANNSIIDAQDANWRDSVDELLRRNATATLRVKNDMHAANAIREFMTIPTDVDVLQFHPRVVGLSRSLLGVDIRVELREARQ